MLLLIDVNNSQCVFLISMQDYMWNSAKISAVINEQRLPKIWKFCGATMTNSIHNSYLGI